MPEPDPDPYRTPEQAARWEARKRATAECQARLIAVAAELLKRPKREPQPGDITIAIRRPGKWPPDA